MDDGSDEVQDFSSYEEDSSNEDDALGNFNLESPCASLESE